MKFCPNGWAPSRPLRTNSQLPLYVSLRYLGSSSNRTMGWWVRKASAYQIECLGVNHQVFYRNKCAVSHTECISMFLVNQILISSCRYLVLLSRPECPGSRHCPKLPPTCRSNSNYCSIACATKCQYIFPSTLALTTIVVSASVAGSGVAFVVVIIVVVADLTTGVITIIERRKCSKVSDRC